MGSEEVKRKKVEPFYSEDNVEKESDASSSPVSFGGRHDHKSNMEHHDRDAKGVSGKDGLEDLWKDMSLAIEYSKVLERLVIKMKGWRSGKETFMISGDSSSEHREWSMDQFNNSTDAKVFFGSIKACGEGISLVGASRIVILDVHLNPSVTRQAIGRAFRPGQKRKVYTYRLVAADSPEEEDHNMSFRKELISKLWFEWG